MNTWSEEGEGMRELNLQPFCCPTCKTKMHNQKTEWCPNCKMWVKPQQEKP